MKWDRDRERKAAKNYNIGMTVFVLLFAIFWCCAVASMGAWPMLIFGLLFIGIAVYRLVICIQMGKGKKENPSAYSQPRQGSDPWERPAGTTRPTGSGYCPYCGTPTGEGFQYCPSCGRKLS